MVLRLEFIIIACLLVIYGWATYQRNFVWKNEFSLWSDVVKKSPGKYRAYNNLGRAYRENRQYSLALSRYQQALRLHPGSSKIYVNMGNVYEETGQVADAVAMYEKALALDPRDFKALILLGDIYRKTGSRDLAIEKLQSAIQINPQPSTPITRWGVCSSIADLLTPQYRNSKKSSGSILITHGPITISAPHMKRKACPMTLFIVISRRYD
jgi:tetratricopeptide (TPR) repeat protein